MLKYEEVEIEQVFQDGNFEDEYVYDVTMSSDTDQNFFANDILVHNSCYLSFNKLMNTLNVAQDDKTRLKVTKFLAQVTMKELKKFNEPFFPNTFNADNTIFFDQELIAKTAIWCQPKKYVCHIVEENGKPPEHALLKKGLDLVRSSIPRKFKDYITEATEKILKGTSEQEMQKYILNIYHEFKTWTYQDIAIPVSCNNLEKNSTGSGMEFDSTVQHMKAAVAYNRFLVDYNLPFYETIKEKDKFKMLFFIKNNKFPINVFGYKDKLPSELKLEQYIDYNQHFERCFTKPLNQIFNAIDWRFPETKYASYSISEFFN